MDLKWERTDLYNLLWQRLGNAPSLGTDFRAACTRMTGEPWDGIEGIWPPPKRLRDDDELQRLVFHAIAGEWMGRDKRRGFPYTWLPNHLADARDQVSPRSFLAAIRTAAEQTPAQGGDLALHYEAIKKGVQKASQIRVAEVREDFFWVATLMDALRGLVIPCGFEEIRKRWDEAGVEAAIEREAEAAAALLPRRLDRGPLGLREDLLDLAFFSQMHDGRLNMPDVYRVGFGLGRKGGVKPIR
ncbi:MAG: hypothetical protein AB1634_11985 [Thermodesulfobacteriota bacterium]